MSKPYIKIPRPVLILHDAAKQKRRLLLVAAIALAGALLLIGLGYGVANRQQVITYLSGEETLRSQIRQLERELKEAQQELVLHQMAVGVSQQAQNSIRQELKNYHTQIAELEEVIEFYKSIMSPDASDKELRADDIQLHATAIPNTYGYTLTLAQFGGEHALVQGQVSLSVEGVLAGEVVSIPHENLIDKGSDAKFSFRYFQELKGQLVVPEKFDAQQITVQVIPSSRQIQNSEYKFNWSIKEL